MALLPGRTMISKWISNEYSRKLVHKWRAEEDAILVGKQTAMHDNPKLNVRDWVGKDPLRVVIDNKLGLGTDLHLFDGTIPTIQYNWKESKSAENYDRVMLPKVDYLNELLADLGRRNIQSVIIEGGVFTLQAFIDAGLWDESRVFSAPVTFGKGISAPQLKDAGIYAREDISGDVLTFYRKNHG